VTVHEHRDEGNIEDGEEREDETKCDAAPCVLLQTFADGRACQNHVDEEERQCDQYGHPDVVASNGPGE